MIVLYILSIVADNIEISTNDFDYLLIGRKLISKADLKEFNSVKISYPGTSIYKLKPLKPRIFYLKDVTKYFKKDESRFVRIDYEYKYLGLVIDAWIMLTIITSVSVYFIFITKKPFGVFEFN
jgi:hypothetical protein